MPRWFCQDCNHCKLVYRIYFTDESELGKPREICEKCAAEYLKQNVVHNLRRIIRADLDADFRIERCKNDERYKAFRKEEPYDYAGKRKAMKTHTHESEVEQ